MTDSSQLLQGVCVTSGVRADVSSLPASGVTAWSCHGERSGGSAGGRPGLGLCLGQAPPLRPAAEVTAGSSPAAQVAHRMVRWGQVVLTLLFPPDPCNQSRAPRPETRATLLGKPANQLMSFSIKDPSPPPHPPLVWGLRLLEQRWGREWVRRKVGVGRRGKGLMKSTNSWERARFDPSCSFQASEDLNRWECLSRRPSGISWLVPGGHCGTWWTGRLLSSACVTGAFPALRADCRVCVICEGDGQPPIAFNLGRHQRPPGLRGLLDVTPAGAEGLPAQKSDHRARHRVTHSHIGAPAPGAASLPSCSWCRGSSLGPSHHVHSLVSRAERAAGCPTSFLTLERRLRPLPRCFCRKAAQCWASAKAGGHRLKGPPAVLALSNFPAPSPTATSHRFRAGGRCPKSMHAHSQHTAQ